MPTTWTVLIVEDDAKARFITRSMIERMGLIVVEAADGLTALELFKQSHADLVLLDANLPQLDGFRVCRKIRGMDFGADVPIVMVTSYADSDSVKKANAAGVTDYVTKPVNWAALSEIICGHLATATQVISVP